MQAYPLRGPYFVWAAVWIAFQPNFEMT